MRSEWQNGCISHQVHIEIATAILSESNSGHLYRDEMVESLVFAKYPLLRLLLIPMPATGGSART